MESCSNQKSVLQIKIYFIFEILQSCHPLPWWQLCKLWVLPLRPSSRRDQIIQLISSAKKAVSVLCLHQYIRIHQLTLKAVRTSKVVHCVGNRLPLISGQRWSRWSVNWETEDESIILFFICVLECPRALTGGVLIIHIKYLPRTWDTVSWCQCGLKWTTIDSVLLCRAATSPRYTESRDTYR